MAIEVRELTIKGKVDGVGSQKRSKRSAPDHINEDVLKAEILDECLDLIRRELAKNNRNW